MPNMAHWVACSVLAVSWISLALAQAGALCPASITLLDTPFDIPNFDVRIGSTIGVENVTSSCECAALCDKESRCDLYSYSTEQKKCFPKGDNSANAVTIFFTADAALRVEGSFASNQISRVSGVTEDDCILGCLDSQRCRYLVFETRGGICSLQQGTNNLGVGIGIKGGQLRRLPVKTTSTTTTTVTTTTAVTTASTTVATTTTAEKTGTQGTIVSQTSTTATTKSSTSSKPSSSNDIPAPDSQQDNKGLIIGLAVAGSVVGIMALGALGFFFFRMAQRKQDTLSRSHGGGIYHGSDDGGVATHSSGLRSTTPPPAPFKKDTIRDSDPSPVSKSPESVYPESSQPSMSPYYAQGQPASSTLGYNSYGYYPPAPSVYAGYNPYQTPMMPTMMPPQTEAYTVEQYIASGWTMEQIKAYNPPILPS
ncbi:hypothetical protein HDU97_009644 [Phlyctochytrium planicorne]|nr:hypothetical protein HDU97_009644 [Phlyctochytrium planicorne]